MADERQKVAGKERRGSIKEALGKLIGNERVEAEGAAEKTAGKAKKRPLERKRPRLEGSEGA